MDNTTLLYPSPSYAQAIKMQQPVASFPGTPVYVWDPLRGMVQYMVPYATPFYAVVYAQAAAAVEQPVPQKGPAPDGQQELTPEEEAFLDEEEARLDERLDAESWHHDESERLMDELQKVAGHLHNDDESYAEIMKLFLAANTVFQLQKTLYQSKASRTQLRAAHLDYLGTRDELRKKMAEYNIDRYPALSLKDLADAKWPEIDHAGFDEKLDNIYKSIKQSTASY